MRSLLVTILPLFCLILVGAPDLFSRHAYQQDPGQNNWERPEQDTTRARKLLQEGQAMIKTEKWRESLPYLLQAEELADRLHHTSLCIRTSSSLFAAYYELGIFDSAAHYVDHLLALAEKVKDVESEMKAWNNKAILYSANLDLDAAHAAYLKAYDLAVTLNDSRSQASFSSNIGVLFGQQRQYEKAIDYFRQAFLIGRSARDSMLVALGGMNIARAYTEAEKFDSAEYYLSVAHQAAWKILDQDPTLYYSVIDIEGLLALRKGALELAESRYKQLEDIYSRNQQNVNLADTYGRLAEIGLARKNYQEAIKYATYNVELLKNVPAQEYRENALLVLAQAYDKLKDHESAYHYSELYRQLRDSSYNEQVTRLLTETNNKFELAKKDRENARLSEEAQRQKAVARQRTIMFLIATLVILVIMSLLSFFYLENRHKKRLNRHLEAIVQKRTAELQQSNLKLQKSNEELRTFGHITSHDLKEPLRNISGFAGLLERRKKDKLGEDGREFLEYIKQNTAQMYELIEDILTYSTLEDLPSRTKIVDLAAVVVKVRKSLKTLIEERHAMISVGNLPHIISNEGQVFMILKNLVENGIKYNRSGAPAIEITYEQINGEHQIFIQDNGIGIPAEYHDQIFQLFKRLHNRSEYSGTGMGLSISRKIALRLGGDIQVKKSTKEGSLFLLTLPAHQLDLAS